MALLGTTRDELGGSEFLRTVRGRDEGPCPEVDLPGERRLVDLLGKLAEAGVLSSAHDVSDGGLAVALAECAIQGEVGAAISLEPGVRPSALLFGESAGRVIVTYTPEALAAVAGAAKKAGVPLARIGRVGGDRLQISIGDRPCINEAVAALAEVWKTSFAASIEAADVL